MRNMRLTRNFRRWRKRSAGMSAWYRLKDFWWFLRGMCWDKHDVLQITTLPCTWQDRDSKLLHANFQILSDFIEQEKPFEHFEWNPDWMPEAAALYHWWKIDYPNRVEPFEMAVAARCVDADCACRNDPFGMFTRHADYRNALDLANKEEQRQYDEETDMLIRLAKIRAHLWT